MDARALLREGKPAEALKALQDRVRAAPASATERIFLFQLLAVMGQWERALTQLNVAAEMEPKLLLAAQLCRPALACEALREEIFEGRRTPLVMGEPQPWVASMVEALQLDAKGKHAAAADLRAGALEQAEAVPGYLDAGKFEWIADADPRLGPLLEAIIDGKYYWVPFANITEVLFEPPTDLRDLVWVQAQFIWSNGGTGAGLIPTRYVGSAASEDGGVRLARKTEWLEQGNGAGSAVTGLGQRLLATDSGEFPILEVRRLSLGEGAEPRGKEA